MDLEKLAGFLPHTFDFYHLGEVKIESSAPDTILLDKDLLEVFDDSAAMSYRIHGDLSALLVLFFPLQLDSSTYQELGNVMASQLATFAHQGDQATLMISAPQKISRSQCASLLKSTPSPIRKTYLHRNPQGVVLLEIWLLTLSTEEPTHV